MASGSLTKDTLDHLLKQITYKGYVFKSRLFPGEGFLVWGEFIEDDDRSRGKLLHQFQEDGSCRSTGCKAHLWKTRKWFVSGHSSQSEILQSLLKLVLCSEEHEAREAFRYQGKALFQPHQDHLKLLECCESVDQRD